MTVLIVGLSDMWERATTQAEKRQAKQMREMQKTVSPINCLHKLIGNSNSSIPGRNTIISSYNITDDVESITSINSLAQLLFLSIF